MRTLNLRTWLAHRQLRRAIILAGFVVPALLLAAAVWLDPRDHAGRWAAVVEERHCRPGNPEKICILMVRLSDGRAVTVNAPEDGWFAAGDTVTIEEIKGRFFGVRSYRIAPPVLPV